MVLLSSDCQNDAHLKYKYMHNHTAYLAPVGFTEILTKELKDVINVYDRLVLAKGDAQVARFSKIFGITPKIIPIRSIGHCAELLRATQRNWWPYEYKYHGRMRLIQEKLPHFQQSLSIFLHLYPLLPLALGRS